MTAPAPRRGLSRAVRWTGMAAGTCLAVLVFMDGGRLRIGGMPSWLGSVLGVVIVWALIVLASVAVTELGRRHHRAAARHGWRLGKRGGAAGIRHGRRGALAAWRWSHPHRARIRAAWRARREPSAGGELAGPDEDPAPTPEPAARRLDVEETPAERVCIACGNPEGGKWGPLVTYQPERDDWLGEHPRLIHQAHFEDESTGFYGRPYKEGTDMTETTPPRRTARDRARAGARRAAGSAGGAWRQLIAATADYEPEDDSALLDWMAGEAAGMASYAESITDVYDTAVSSVGLDPVPLAALHDYADAAAACAEAMAAARAKFAEHYSQVREFAAAGGLLPHDGRWITGEGGE